MAQFARVRTVVTVAAAVLVLAAATATAAALITGADVKNGSLTGDDIKDGSLAANEIKDATLKGADVKDGSLGMVDMGSSVKKSIPIRVTADLPTNGFVVTAASTLVENTGDGVTFGPYENGGGEFGSLCTSVLDGLPLGDVTHLAFIARYTAEGDTGGVGVPYLRVFLGGTDRIIFSPNTQPPDPDNAEGPFHTWVATAGVWRYNDDGGSGGEYGVNGAPFPEVVGDHGTEVISDICISVGNTAGTNLTALLRSWEINSTDYAFGQ